MIRSLETFADGYRRNDPERYEEAIADYEEDLRYLRSKYGHLIFWNQAVPDDE